jgi:hypothetical protein
MERKVGGRCMRGGMGKLKERMRGRAGRYEPDTDSLRTAGKPVRELSVGQRPTYVN